MKPIRLSEHAVSYTRKRGFSVEEVEQAIQTEPWSSSEQGGNRLQCSKEFRFNDIWNGKYYAAKKDRPIFMEEEF